MPRHALRRVAHPRAQRSKAAHCAPEAPRRAWVQQPACMTESLTAAVPCGGSNGASRTGLRPESHVRFRPSLCLTPLGDGGTLDAYVKCPRKTAVGPKCPRRRSYNFAESGLFEHENADPAWQMSPLVTAQRPESGTSWGHFGDTANSLARFFGPLWQMAGRHPGRPGPIS